jgi:hypothetical protein
MICRKLAGRGVMNGTVSTMMLDFALPENGCTHRETVKLVTYQLIAENVIVVMVCVLIAKMDISVQQQAHSVIHTQMSACLIAATRSRDV